jgi:uncharacterized transporter YbjL
MLILRASGAAYIQSSHALNISRSDASTVFYATAYPLTMVLRNLPAQILVLLLCG